MRLALTLTDRRELAIIAEKSGRPDLALKLTSKRDNRAALKRLERRKIKYTDQSEEIHLLRNAAMKRANGFGELCGFRLTDRTDTVWKTEFCHLDGGIGRRRQKQGLWNCLIEHQQCHRHLDAHPEKYLQEVKNWAERHNYPIPERFRKLEARNG